MVRFFQLDGDSTPPRTNPPRWWSRRLPVVESAFDNYVAERLPEHSPLVFKAKELARQIHEGQTRIGGGPYLIHPLRVAISLMDELSVSDPLLICAGVLHDVIEDSDYNVRKISEQFGSFVAELVSTLSRRKGEKRPSVGDSFDSSYFKRVLKRGEPAILLKTADKIDNLRDAIYHPSGTKRRILVEEIPRVFVPLIESVADIAVRERLNSMLHNAAQVHDLRSLITNIDDQARKTPKGEPLIVPPACRDDALLHYLLFNPMLSCWISDDGIQLTKSLPSSAGVAVNVARKYAEFIANNRAKDLLEFTSIPAQLASPRNARHWLRTALQLEDLCSLLIQEQVPEWCMPVCEADSAPWLLLFIHSALYRPANWIFPIWHSDYGAALAGTVDRSPYAHSHARSETEAFHGFLRFLLTNRQAVERLFAGVGTLHRAEAVFAAAPIGIPLRIIWSARLLSEYLDAATENAGAEPSRQFEKFSMMWEALLRHEFNTEALAEIQRQKPVAGIDTASSSPTRIEIIGLDEVRKIFDESNRIDEFRILLNLLTGFCYRNAGDLNPWISFETSEFVKRREVFAGEGGLRLTESSSFEALEKCGIRTLFRQIDGSVVLKVFPAKRFALRNRLPEISEAADLKAISDSGYCAEKIFDTLVGDRLNKGEAVWVPRVYRILDTMEDLDPENVQAIDIKFLGPEDEAEFRAYLPLPGPDNRLGSGQEERKKIIAQYIVTQIYNHGITRCLLSARIECGVLDGERKRAGHGFTNDSLMEMLLDAEQTLGLRGAYGRFIECFNFSPFQFLNTNADEGTLAFEALDMRSGVFLGIDIGGTDIKFALFAGGTEVMLKSGASLGKMPTFGNKDVTEVESETFCNAIVSTISESFDEPGKTWSQISGIGICWPGAVRDNRVAGISGTLAKLRYKETIFKKSSPANEIHSFPLLEVFRKSLQSFAHKHCFKLDPSLTLVLENDGNSEAFGNYCSRVLKNENKPGGKLIVKLGTSLAGGRVRQDSAIAGDVAEFSKIVLNLNGSSPDKPEGIAREYVSSEGVRNLSRTFKFRDKILFGPRGIENTESESRTRIEAIELGGLLDLWRAGVSDNARDAYLKELAETDNQPEGPELEKSLKGLETQLMPGGNLTQALSDYAAARVRDWAFRNRSADKGEGQELLVTEDGREGWARVRWLCAGEQTDSLAAGVLAEKILGTVALFSQLGLQIAHLVAALYNIYRRDCFNEVILAGGVLSGLTGALVKRQTEAFLQKYYDKIFGEGRSLPADAIQLAQSDNRDLMGPLGAAMLGNRAHKSERLHAMRKLVDFVIRESPAGKALRTGDLVSELRERGIHATELEVRDYVYTRVAESILIPELDEQAFIKTIEASS